MSRPGIGAMIHYLKGGSVHSAEEYYGLKVTEAKIVDNKLRLAFDNGKKIEIWDDGQSCCESRYITCDDDVKSLINGTINKIEAKEGPCVEGEYGDTHEQVFVEIGTDKGFITLANHNEHNGYYGSFGLTITELKS